MFVDKEAILPHNHRVRTGSGKIGAVGKVDISQALHQTDGKGRQQNCFPSPQNGRPVHPRSRTWHATRLRETESVTLNEYFTIKSGCVDKHRTTRIFFSAFLRTGTHSCIISAPLQVVAVDWTLSSRIISVGLEPIWWTCWWWLALGLS